MEHSTSTEQLPEAPLSQSAERTSWPRITLVTAVHNGARYLEQTIRSIVYQGYPNLEYIVVDGLSTDGTLEIIRKYEKHLAWWVSQPDNGVYDALNNGFARSTGEILAWLNAGDMLHTRALFAAGSVFAAFPAVEWITGRPTGFSKDGITFFFPPLPRWSRYRYLAVADRHIQQESTFWRRRLWDRAGGHLDASYRDVGDCDLWVRFFRHAQLYSVDALIGGYCFHDNSISRENLNRFNQRCDEIIETELKHMRGYNFLKLLRKIDRTMRRIRRVRFIWAWTGIPILYWCLDHTPGPDLPPVIEHQQVKWGFRGK